MSIESLKSLNQWLFLLSVGLPILGGMCALAQYFVSQKIGAIEGVQQSKTLAAITAKVEPRRIATYTALVEALRAMAPRHVHVLIDAADTETAEFGESLIRILKNAGLGVNGAHGRFSLPSGLAVVVRDKTITPEQRLALEKGFEGTPGVRVLSGDDPGVARLRAIDAPIVFYVGRR